MGTIQGILLDIDGVLHVSMQPIPGAAEALSWLAQHGYPFTFVTNTTTMARDTLAQRLQGIGLPVSAQQIVTAPVAAAEYIRQHFAGKRCWVLSKGDSIQDFAGIELDQSAAEVIVIGGAEELLTYEAMNQAFRLLMDGATLIALHKNRYWKTKQGLQLDSGPFIQALEIATGKQALVIGKPERAFFAQALQRMHREAHTAIMVGDDIENDVGGGQQAGMRGILVCTGKHSAQSPLLEHIKPDAILASIADLPAWLQRVDG
ncbi:MAG TPA: TIGR01458 family HAD-type hydrolase [Dictyobacter sp.]|jgi:HAD superfamily hydrolase (TIGR01458 family)|nr:TIGR01458 family HAD-type hydrolase [Dictyobacter sp.]